MITDSFMLLDPDDLNVVRAPKAKKIKFKENSRATIYDKWNRIRKNIDANVETVNKGISNIQINANDNTVRNSKNSNRAIKLVNRMFTGIKENINRLTPKQEEPQELVPQNIENSVDDTISIAATVSPVEENIVAPVQEFTGELNTEEIKDAVNQAFADVKEEVKEQQAVAETGKANESEKNTTKVVKNANGKAKVQKFIDGEYRLTREEIDPSFRITRIDGSEYRSINDDIFGKSSHLNNSNTVNREVPIVAAEREVSTATKEDENHLFQFAEKDNSVSSKATTYEDSTSKNIADLGRLYDEFNHEQQSTQKDSTDSKQDVSSVDTTKLEEAKKLREELLALRALKEEQDRKTKEAAAKALQAEEERRKIVQQTLMQAEAEKRALEESLNASKKEEVENRTKAQREQAVINELAAMFQDTPVNFVISTKSAAKGGK